MKYLPLSFCLLLSIACFSQNLTEAARITTFCRVWGFLKYHHPSVAKGRFDWDKQFMENLPVISKCRTKDEVNNFYDKWITNLGRLKPGSRRVPPRNAILTNYNNDWIRDTAVFTGRMTELLTLVQNNSRSKNHYVTRRYLGLSAASYVNENKFKDSIDPSASLRLLTLARYWNIVNYFYPYKYLTDTDWEEVLAEFVREVTQAESLDKYHFALQKLFTKVNDSHTRLSFAVQNSEYSIPSFRFKIIDDKIVILDAYNDSICRKYDLRYGDVIESINGKPVRTIIEHYANLIPASNYASLCRRLTSQLIWSDISDSAVITFGRDGHVSDKRIMIYPLSVLFKKVPLSQRQSLPRATVINHQVFERRIGYINLGLVRSKNEIKSILNKMRQTDAVILDIRNYPDNSLFHPITNFFCSSRHPFAKYAKQSIRYPGVLKCSKTVYCGNKRGKKYKGRVAVLINESTMSFAEHFTMALKTIPNVLLVGSNTAGANGANHSFSLPGNITTSYSNEGVYYPNGDYIQRKGIIPDVRVIPTIEGTRARKDEVLEKAVQILSKTPDSR